MIVLVYLFNTTHVVSEDKYVSNVLLTILKGKFIWNYSDWNINHTMEWSDYNTFFNKIVLLHAVKLVFLKMFNLLNFTRVDYENTQNNIYNFQNIAQILKNKKIANRTLADQMDGK